MWCLAIAVPIFGEEPQPSETSNTVEEGEVPVLTLPQLKIEVLNPPKEDCQRKTQPGDWLSVHFVGTLAETKQKFDSR